MDSTVEEEKLEFTLTIPTNDFNNLIMETCKRQKNKKGKIRIRIVNVLKPNEWTSVITKRFFDDFRIFHGYHFKNHYISGNRQTGAFKGKYL